MKTIQLQIDDKNYESFLNIVNSLKKGFIKNITITDTIESVSDNEQKYYEKLLDNISNDDKIVSSKESIQL
ncbi:hypothetical protein [Arcobacter roscoffensis]|uniref:Uncharacterized protein n=1 Tax=Arcobacter roscoffensis TaxID=2961520 RepID=A0ABY5E0S3_9BACT|nr:hypothetical protein [Arcobacter roscoffensis]UTJ05310.1 hypothetical protein NJU99_08515 [Arcobacter roscoffensis]